MSKLRSMASNKQGFTIVELMIATMVFSVILLLITFGMLQVGRTYYKGITSTKTQNAARSIMDRISQAIQFSGGEVKETPPVGAPGTVYAFCINDQQYSFLIDKQLTDGSPNPDQSKHVLVVDTPAGGCNTTTPPDLNNPADLKDAMVFPDAVDPEELMGANMRLAKLSVTPDPTDPGITDPSLGISLWRITVKVVYGDNDLLINDSTDPDYHQKCAASSAGTQFCAFSELSTVVKKRVK